MHTALKLQVLVVAVGDRCEVVLIFICGRTDIRLNETISVTTMKCYGMELFRLKHFQPSLSFTHFNPFSRPLYE